MADSVHIDAQRLRRTAWRYVAGGGLLIALSGALLAIMPKLLSVRADTAAPPPRQSDRSKDESAAVRVADEKTTPKVAFETTDWALTPVFLALAGTLVLLVVSCFVLIVAYPHALPDVGRTVRIAPPGPRLQTNPQGDLQQFRSEEERRLSSFYWIDKDKGIVHVPIEQAMRKLATSGIDGFPKGQP